MKRIMHQGGTATGIVLEDGNTVTALWNYAQNYAMSDNSFGTVYGPSTPGALNLISVAAAKRISNTGFTSVSRVDNFR